LDDLKKKLLHQWDFVTMQAEAQFRYDVKQKFAIISLSFRVLKDRKKTDKTIIDSQERAFWRVMRPSVSNLFIL
jgi:hypothetical protein